jgi:hypothetical protein
MTNILGYLFLAIMLLAGPAFMLVLFIYESRPWNDDAWKTPKRK